MERQIIAPIILPLQSPTYSASKETWHSYNYSKHEVNKQILCKIWSLENGFALRLKLGILNDKVKFKLKKKTIYLTKLQCNKTKYHQDRILVTPLD